MIKLIFYFFSIVILTSQLVASKNIEWKLALNWKSTLSPLASPPFKMAQMVKEMSNGKFVIKIDGLEKHNNPSNLFQMTQKNVYQMAHTNSTFTQNKEINTIWFTGIPFGMTTKEQYSWFYYGGGEKYMKKIYKPYNLLAFPAGDLGAQMGGWFKKEIHTLSDFKNLNVNTTGIINEILSMYNVKHNKIPSNEINTAFLNGDLDMIEGTSPSMDIKMGFHKLAPFYYTSWSKPASQTQFLVNKDIFDALPTQYQIILTTAIKMVSYDLYYENFYESSKAWNKIKKEFPNIQIKTLPTEILNNLQNTKKIIFEQYAKKNKLFKEIYKSQINFQKKARQWSELEEFSYIQSVNKLD